jgi:type II secretory pathway pseudopilin PulG
MRTVPIRRAKPSEEGYILVVVMFMLALLIISMAVAIPKIAADIQRDREFETMHRGLQYRRAIQLYYRKFHRYPPNLDALVKTNEIRFLRKKYVDPTTGKAEWKPIMIGQNKTPMAMGFFGQPLGGIGGGVLGGVGPGGNSGIAGANPIVGGTGSLTATSGSFGNANPTDPNAGSTFGTPTDPNAGSTFGTQTDPNAGSSTITGASPIPGQAFGGAGIIGVAPMSPKQSIFVYKKMNHYDAWEFLYSPLSDQGAMGMNPGGGIQPSIPGVGAPGTPFNGGAPAPTPTPAPAPTPQQ